MTHTPEQMTLICNIQGLREKYNPFHPYTFEELSRKTVEELRGMQDAEIKRYNKRPRFEIRYHGIEAPDYFQGASAYGTHWSECMTGIGNNNAEAYEDAAEQIAMSYGICLPDHPPTNDEEPPEEMFYYVTIYFNP